MWFEEKLRSDVSRKSIGLNFVAVAGLIAGVGWCLIPPVGLKGPGSWQAPGLHTQLWVVVVFVGCCVGAFSGYLWLVGRAGEPGRSAAARAILSGNGPLSLLFFLCLSRSLFPFGTWTLSLSLSVSLVIYIYLSAYLVSSRIFLLLAYLLKCISSKAYYGALY